MKISRPAAGLIGAALLGAMSGHLYAMPGLLLATDNQSSVTASANAADSNLYPPDVVNNINSLPFTTPTTNSAATSSSEVDSNVSTNGLSFTFTQSSSEPSYRTSGFGSVFFTAPAGTQFSITGNLSTTGLDYEATISVNLYDVSQGYATVYSYYGDGFYYPENVLTNSVGDDAPIQLPVSFTLDGSQGTSTTGTLNGTDEYWFAAQETLTNEGDPTLGGNVAISFTAPTASAPLPASALAGVSLMALLEAGALRRRSTHSA